MGGSEAREMASLTLLQNPAAFIGQKDFQDSLQHTTEGTNYIDLPRCGYTGAVGVESGLGYCLY